MNLDDAADGWMLPTKHDLAKRTNVPPAVGRGNTATLLEKDTNASAKGNAGWSKSTTAPVAFTPAKMRDLDTKKDAEGGSAGTTPSPTLDDKPFTRMVMADKDQGSPTTQKETKLALIAAEEEVHSLRAHTATMAVDIQFMQRKIDELTASNDALHRHLEAAQTDKDKLTLQIAGLVEQVRQRTQTEKIVLSALASPFFIQSSCW